MSKRNVYPNTYVISYTDRKGKHHTGEMKGLTKHEAIIRFRARDITIQNVTARLKQQNVQKISDLFY